jgi:hypothetical protein
MLWFDALEGGADGGFGYGAESLGGIILVALEFYTSDTVGVAVDGEGLDGGFRAEGAAREALALRTAVR